MAFSIIMLACLIVCVGIDYLSLKRIDQNGALLGVTLPPDAAALPEVQSIVQQYLRWLRIICLLCAAGGVGLFFLPDSLLRVMVWVYFFFGSLALPYLPCLWGNRALQKLRDARSLRELMAADTIWVNGVEYKNLHQLAWLFDRERLKTLFAADPVGTIHGDLTIENIICRLNPGANGGWYLIDPNTGNLHESPFLDYGKLLQSLHGSYEFMMKTPRVTVQGSRIDFALTRSAAYDALYRALMADLQSRYPAAQVESILMHEVIHWLRLMPYKLAKDRKRAPMFYAGLVMVANDVANFAKGENVC